MNCQIKAHRGQDPSQVTRRWFFRDCAVGLRDRLEGAYDRRDVSSRAGVRLVRCPDWERGPGASLRCGLGALEDDVEAAVVLMADGPDLSPAAVGRVVEDWRAQGGAVVAASYAGERGHPLVVARSAWADVPDDGLRVVSPRLVPCDDLGAPGDVDTPADLPPGA